MNGNVGIGVNNPLVKLDISGNIKSNEIDLSDSIIKLNGILGTPNQIMKVDSTGTKLEWKTDDNTSPWDQNGSNIYFNSGKVSIGTNNPENKTLRVQGNSQIIGAFQVNGNIKCSDLNTETEKIKLNGSFGNSNQIMKVNLLISWCNK